jgi:DNA polymerase-4
VPDRIILHCDCDSFFASVEEVYHPEYKNVPMAVAGDPKARHGIILAKNLLAKKAGVKTAEPIWEAQRKCPALLLTKPRHGDYSRYCEQINRIYGEYTDLVEPAGIDESYLDITGSLLFFGCNPLELAQIIQRRIHEEIGVTISIGISWNKIFAKLGSDQNKPEGIFVITRDNVSQCVYNLPVSALMMVGKKTNEMLEKHGIRTIGDLAAANVTALRQYAGKAGEMLHRFACGRDDSPVSPNGNGEPIKSIGNGMTFQRDLINREDIKIGLTALCNSVARRLRKHNFKCCSVQVTIKNTALQTIQRQKTLPRPTFLSAELTEAALALVEANWSAGKPIRMLTVTAQNLTVADSAAEQMTLFDTEGASNKRMETLEQTLDTIRQRYGGHSIQAGLILHNNIGVIDHDENADFPLKRGDIVD